MTDVSKLTADAVDMARVAGALTLDWFQDKGLTVEHKDDGSPVTAADRAAERLLREQICERYPDDAIVGEEEVDKVGTSGRRWFVDPIDGTKAFSHGVPLYSTLVAVEDSRGMVAGVIALPGLDEIVWAGRGLGCFHNGERCSVNDTPTLDGSFAMTSGLDAWSGNMLRDVLASPMYLQTWGDAYGYALVATGRVEAMIDPIANVWDLAPMSVIMSEAGGRFSTLENEERADGGNGIASNGSIHEELLALLNRSR